MNNKLIKVIGIGATVLGVVTTLVTNWVNDKNLDHKISTEVAKAIAETSTKIGS